MSARLADILRPHLDGVRAVTTPNAPAAQLRHFVADLGLPIRSETEPGPKDLAVLRVDATAASLDDLRLVCTEAPPGALIAALLYGGGTDLSTDAVAAAMTESGAEIVTAAATVYPSYPVVAVIRRLPRRADDTADLLVQALESCREAPEGTDGDGGGGLLALDPDVRARLDRMRSETARMRTELRQATARAESAESALVRVESSTSWKVGRLLVAAAKNPRSALRLPRELLALWRLRTARRRSAAPASSAPAAIVREVGDPTGAHLLHPKVSGAASASQLTIVGVLSSSVARHLASHASITLPSPQNAAATMEAVDADLVLIDTAAAVPPSPWSHLGDPSAADRERGLLALIDAAHDLGRPVVLLRSGDLSLSAGLLDLSARCDLVLASGADTGLTRWQPGPDLALSYGPAGGERSVPLVWIGDLDARTPRRVNDAVVRTLRAAGTSARIHPRLDAITEFPVPWPADLLPMVGAPVDDGDITQVLSHARMALVASEDDTIAVRARCAGARVLVAGDADESTLLSSAPMSDLEHRAALRTVFARQAAPVSLDALCRLLRLERHPLRSRDCAVWVQDIDPTGVAALLNQSHRPTELIVPLDCGADLRELQEAGIAIRRGDVRSESEVRRLVDAPVVVRVSPGELASWQRAHLSDVALNHELRLRSRPRSADAPAGILASQGAQK